MDVIKEDSELSIFYANLKKTGLDEVLQKKLPWKWTIFAPTDKAFKASPERVQKEILSNEFYNKSIIMDHPYNKEWDGPRVKNWKQIYEIINDTTY